MIYVGVIILVRVSWKNIFTLSIRRVDGSTIVEWLIETAVPRPMGDVGFAQTELLTLPLRHLFYRRILGVIVTERSKVFVSAYRVCTSVSGGREGHRITTKLPNSSLNIIYCLKVSYRSTF